MSYDPPVYRQGYSCPRREPDVPDSLLEAGGESPRSSFDWAPLRRLVIWVVILTFLGWVYAQAEMNVTNAEYDGEEEPNPVTTVHQ